RGRARAPLVAGLAPGGRPAARTRGRPDVGPLRAELGNRPGGSTDAAARAGTRPAGTAVAADEHPGATELPQAGPALRVAVRRPGSGLAARRRQPVLRPDPRPLPLRQRPADAGVGPLQRLEPGPDHEHPAGVPLRARIGA